MRYDPATFKALSFHDAVPHFTTGKDTPRAYLERCLEQIAAREPVVKAFVVVNEALARAAADASSARCKAGQPLSAIDGMPIAVNMAVNMAIQHLLETKDIPSDCGGAALHRNATRRETRHESAAVWALREAGP